MKESEILKPTEGETEPGASTGDKERNSAEVKKAAALGLEEALGDLLGNLGNAEPKGKPE